MWYFQKFNLWLTFLLSFFTRSFINIPIEDKGCPGIRKTLMQKFYNLAVLKEREEEIATK